MLRKDDDASQSGFDDAGSGQGLWKALRQELAEIAWLAAVIGALSAAGVVLAVLLAGV